MHPANPHKHGYDMQALVQALPELGPFVFKNKFQRDTVNFSDPLAVKLLNKALLKAQYGLLDWDIPEGYLCPPIPGRLDYLCYLSEFLEKQGIKPDGPIRALDVGTGANLIYPLLADRMFQWQVIGSDCDETALVSAQQNIQRNQPLGLNIQLRQQKDSQKIFTDVIQPDDYFHVTLCNPPFHESQQAAQAGSMRKNKNLNQNKQKRASNVDKIASKEQLNFAGQANELWCKGGEKRFIQTMIRESVQFKDQVGWFSCLVSKKETLTPIQKVLKKVNANVVIVPMEQGNKISRFIAWRIQD